jgi:hypothetical protein
MLDLPCTGTTRQRMVDLSMPGYIAKALERFQHPTPKRAQHSPHEGVSSQYGAQTQLTEPEDTSPPLLPVGIQFLQQVIGTLLYLARAVDNTMLGVIGSIASSQKTTLKQQWTKSLTCSTTARFIPTPSLDTKQATWSSTSIASYLLASQARSEDDFSF